MRLGPRGLIGALALVGAPELHAQVIPDTTAPWDYFPLSIGDTWHYHVQEHHYQACWPCSYHVIREVVETDTIGSRPYSIVEVRAVNVPPMPYPPEPLSYQHVRFDTASATPLRRELAGVEYPWWTDGCRLDEPFPIAPDTSRSTTCPNGWPATVHGGYNQPLPFGGTAAVKELRRPGLITRRTTFAAGIGPLALHDDYEINEWLREELVFARVAGVEYGTPIVATEPAPPAGGPSLVVSPNPADGRVTVAIHAGAAGGARVALHDQLGREVLVAHDGWLHTGDHRVAVDVDGLRAGVYVVRATGAGGTLAATLVVR